MQRDPFMTKAGFTPAFVIQSDHSKNVQRFLSD